MQILSKETKELLTHFEMIKGLLVVRLFYGNTKTEFGVTVDGEMRWVRQLAQMIHS